VEAAPQLFCLRPKAPAQCTGALLQRIARPCARQEHPHRLAAYLQGARRGTPKRKPAPASKR